MPAYATMKSPISFDSGIYLDRDELSGEASRTHRRGLGCHLLISSLCRHRSWTQAPPRSFAKDAPENDKDVSPLLLSPSRPTQQMTDLTSPTLAEARDGLAPNLHASVRTDPMRISGRWKPARSVLNAYVLETFDQARAAGGAGMLTRAPPAGRGRAWRHSAGGFRRSAVRALARACAQPCMYRRYRRKFRAALRVDDRHRTATGGRCRDARQAEQHEFAMGSAIETCLGPVINPWQGADDTRRQSSARRLVQAVRHLEVACRPLGLGAGTETDTGVVRSATPMELAGIVGSEADRHGRCSCWAPPLPPSAQTGARLRGTVRDTAIPMRSMAGYDPEGLHLSVDSRACRLRGGDGKSVEG